MFALSYLTLLQPTYTGIRWAPLFMELPSKNTGLACHFLLQGIFPTQELNPRLPHWQDSLPLSHPGGPFHNHIFLIKMSKSYESWILSYIKNLFYSVYIFININTNEPIHSGNGYQSNWSELNGLLFLLHLKGAYTDMGQICCCHVCRQGVTILYWNWDDKGDPESKDDWWGVVRVVVLPWRGKDM